MIGSTSLVLRRLRGRTCFYEHSGFADHDRAGGLAPIPYRGSGEVDRGHQSTGVERYQYHGALAEGISGDYRSPVACGQRCAFQDLGIRYLAC